VGVSDNYLRVIPTVPDWTPEHAQAAAALRVMQALCPDGAAEIRRYDEVTFIDQGGNFEHVRCPRCVTELEHPWWQDAMDRAYHNRFVDLATVTPCCSAAVSLNELNYDWPAGFAQFELSVQNPNRGWLSDQEMAQVADTLGHPVRQILCHV
jgi:hypothetical protein